MITSKNLPMLLAVLAVGYYFYSKRQAATVLDRRYPMAYT